MEIELSQLIKKFQMSNYIEILPVGAEIVADRRTKGHDEANNPLSQFYPRTHKIVAIFFVISYNNLYF